MKVYIVNLNKERIFILSGILLIVIGFSFWVGSIFGQSKQSAVATNDIDNIKTEKEINQLVIDGKKTAVTNNGTLVSSEKQEETNSGKIDLEELYRKSQQENNNSTIQSINQNNEEDTKSSLAVEKDPFIKSPSQKKKTVSTHTKKISSHRSVRSKSRVYYSLQIAAYKQKNDANVIVKKLRKKRFKVRIDRGIRFYYVRIGKTADKRIIKKLQKKIEKIVKVKTMIVKKKLS